MDDEVIISPDTLRSERLPPRQTLEHHLPVVHAGEVPPFEPALWDLSLFPVPLIDQVVTFTWPEFLKLPRVKVFADVHSVLGWSRLNNLWEGVATRELRKFVHIAPTVKYVMVHAEYGVSTNMPIEEFFGEDCLLAIRHDNQELLPEQGAPVRLVIPRLYDWKSLKWVRGIEFMEEDHPGFWEDPQNGGYHMLGNPWLEQRFRTAGIT